MGIQLWIDDVRVPPTNESWVWVKNSKDALEILHSNISIDTISFDHDLGGEDTTIPVVNELEAMAYHGLRPYIKCYVHSANPVGRDKLQKSIESCEYFWNLNSLLKIFYPQPLGTLSVKVAGSKGGKTRAKKLSAERRKEISSKAAKARWSKNGK